MVALSGLSVLALVLGAGCRGGGGSPEAAKRNTVVWAVLSDVERLNPFTSTDEAANYVQGEIWEPLNGGNPRNQDPLPLLASLPTVSADNLTYTYTMDPTARWSDRKPVTAADVIFSYKTALNPRVINSQQLRMYFITLDSVYCPGGDSTKVEFHINKFRFDAPKILGQGYVKIIPKHIFDPKNLSDKMSWAELHNSNTKDAAISEFAQWFESAEIARDPKYLIGSGAYVFKEWATNDHITLTLDTNYWAKDHPWQDAYPKEIVFKTIRDQNGMLTALKAHNIDIDDGVTPVQYVNQLNDLKDKQLKKDTTFGNVFTFIAWNNARPLFSDKRVRRALSMLIDRDKIQTSILRGYAKKINGPVTPVQLNYDATIPAVPHDIEGAKKLLAEAGWTDSDGDGVLDKVINGKKTPFKFTFQVNSGNDTRKNILLVAVEDLKKAGIMADISQLEWSVFLENTKSHNYDAAYGGWVGNYGEDDISQLWKSDQSKNKGSNWYSYDNPEADKLMAEILVEPDQAKRFDLSHKLQRMIADDQPVTFMFTTPYFLAWYDRFDNFELFHTRPPFDPRYWIVRGSGIQRNPHGVPMGVSEAPKPVQ